MTPELSAKLMTLPGDPAEPVQWQNSSTPRTEVVGGLPDSAGNGEARPDLGW